MTNTQPMLGWSSFHDRPFVRVSALNDFIRCPRRFFYRYGCFLQSNEPGIALHFGEAIHAALGWLLGHPGDLPGALGRFDNCWTPELEGLGSHLGNKAMGIRMLLAWMNAHQPGRSIYNAIEPPRNLGGIVPTEKQSDYEISFVLDLGFKHLLAGRIDALARHRSTNELWTVEFKTTSDATERFFNGFGMNCQMLSYALACRGWGLPVIGCFVEGLEKKKELKTKETEHKVQIQPVQFQDHLLEDHLKFVRYKLAELESMIERQDFPKHFSGCNTYSVFGQPGYNCDFTMLCQIPDWTLGRQLFKLSEDQVFQLPKEPLVPLTIQGVLK